MNNSSVLMMPSEVFLQQMLTVQIFYNAFKYILLFDYAKNKYIQYTHIN